jgi:hypothetical protein
MRDRNARTWLSNLRQRNVVMSLAELGPEDGCAGEDQQQLKTIDPTSRQRGCYMKTITASVNLGKEVSARKSRGACRQDELIGGKSPVIK